MGLHQTRKLLHNKGNHQKRENATHWMGENIGLNFYLLFIPGGIGFKAISSNSLMHFPLRGGLWAPPLKPL